MSTKRIAILGAGANGASIGADLARAGCAVTLIEQWPAHVESMRANGVRIVMPTETFEQRVSALHLCDVATLRQPFDIVLMLVKAYDTEWAAHLIEPYLATDGLLVGVQNGLTTDAIAGVVGAHRTMGCVIEITSAMFEPGIIERHSAHDRSWFAIGSIDDVTRGREEEVAQLLAHAGSVDIVDDIRATKWMKLVSNSTTLVTTAILGLPMIEAAAIPEMRAFMLRSGQEALEATTTLGNAVLPIFGLGTEEMRDTSVVVETLLDTLLGGFVMPNSTTTVLQDWMKGRRSEVDQLNGEVVNAYRALGRRAPANEAVVQLAHSIELGHVQPSIGNLPLLLQLEAEYSA
jgi:2-dehydropantoate 2-reductase